VLFISLDCFGVSSGRDVCPLLNIMGLQIHSKNPTATYFFPEILTVVTRDNTQTSLRAVSCRNNFFSQADISKTIREEENKHLDLALNCTCRAVPRLRPRVIASFPSSGSRLLSNTLYLDVKTKAHIFTPKKRSEVTTRPRMAGQR